MKKIMAGLLVFGSLSVYSAEICKEASEFSICYQHKTTPSISGGGKSYYINLRAHFFDGRDFGFDNDAKTASQLCSFLANGKLESYVSKRSKPITSLGNGLRAIFKGDGIVDVIKLDDNGIVNHEESRYHISRLQCTKEK